MFKKVDPKMSFPKVEEEILRFWDEQKIFEKSIKQRDGAKRYSFYDGPPFATGTPHYGHIVASAIKDTVPRYFTMKGFQVERKWGWDCHGLPIENIAEKELGITHKKEIENLGVEKFNETCRSKVLEYVAEWKKVIRRFGRWADMENAYKTMDINYMESVWWVFKELWGKGLIYESYRAMHICPRCETTLSQSEVAEGYKMVKDFSVVVKFELVNEPGTFLLAWTTTPWTLPGNVALAINENIVYCKIKKGTDVYVVAKNRLEILGNGAYEILEEFKGKKLIGEFYKPLFDYYAKDENLENHKNGWKIYAADFVTTEDGTGIVHIAPAFGDDDMELGKRENLPFVQHVKTDGTIKNEVANFAGMQVKPKENPQATDVEIIKYLAHKELLFAKEKYEHSYPHCWRCDTPLLNYATSSWFVNVIKVKERALELAKNINWLPAHLKEGRFGKWLETARDWSISRQRYWASVLPIWKCKKCDEVKVIGSRDELKENSDQKITKIIFVRHGESEKNVSGVLSDIVDKWPLTQKGRDDAEALGEMIKDKIDVIISSPILRARETAEILNKKFKTDVVNSEWLREVAYGKWNNMTVFERQLATPELYNEYQKIIKDPKKRFIFKLGASGESRADVLERTREFLKWANINYSGKTILAVGHGMGYATLRAIFENLSEEEYFCRKMEDPDHNDISRFYLTEKGGVLDLHKDTIDQITFQCAKCQETMHRIPDVLDTWFDSGSMPYAHVHYPFENKEKFQQSFPADFIGEGVDQTRAWFYYLHVIATSTQNSHAFRNVIVNGTVVAEDGRKMSKRLKNYPDPMDIINKYGADVLRFYLISSPVVAAEDIAFSERELSDISRNMFRMLWNSYSFFTTYASIDKWAPSAKATEGRVPSSENLLDHWILSELQLLIQDVTKSMDNYELSKAARAFTPFIDNLSNWYIRRSRKRFWKSEDDSDKGNAYQTLHTVLVTIAKLMAPFTPFLAEEMYRNLSSCHSERVREPRNLVLDPSASSEDSAGRDDNLQSVHLADWPKPDEKLIDKKLNEEMQSIRNLVTEGLKLRAEAKVKVRQPIASLKIKMKKSKIKNELTDIIKDEMNVKEIIFDDAMAENIVLNTEITEKLKLEGEAREIIRAIQEGRKKAGFNVEDRIILGYLGKERVFEKFDEMIAKEILAVEMDNQLINDAKYSESIELEGEKFEFQLKRV
jgi:isoleucyl-tRNA synthetase